MTVSSIAQLEHPWRTYLGSNPNAWANWSHLQVNFLGRLHKNRP